MAPPNTNRYNTTSSAITGLQLRRREPDHLLLEHLPTFPGFQRFPPVFHLLQFIISVDLWEREWMEGTRVKIVSMEGVPSVHVGFPGSGTVSRLTISGPCFLSLCLTW